MTINDEHYKSRNDNPTRDDFRELLESEMKSSVGNIASIIANKGKDVLSLDNYDPVDEALICNKLFDLVGYKHPKIHEAIWDTSKYDTLKKIEELFKRLI